VPIHSFSIGTRSSRLILNVPRGRKSAFVDNAIQYWHENRSLWENKFTRQMLHDTDLSTLQLIAWKNYRRAEDAEDRIRELEQELDEIARASEIADDKAKKVPPSRGLKRFFKSWPL